MCEVEFHNFYITFAAFTYHHGDIEWDELYRDHHLSVLYYNIWSLCWLWQQSQMNFYKLPPPLCNYCVLLKRTFLTKYIHIQHVLWRTCSCTQALTKFWSLGREWNKYGIIYYL